MTVLPRDTSVRAPHWAFSPPPGTGLACPLPRHRALPEFSTTSSVLNTKSVSARGLRNTLSAEKLAGCVVSGKIKPKVSVSAPCGFLPSFLVGGVVGFMEFGTSSGVPQVLYSASQGKQVLASTRVYIHPE